MANVPRTIKVMCATVLMLAAFCSSALASGPFTLNPFTSQSTIVPHAQKDNVTLTIYKNHSEESEPFQVSNMFPGDTVTKRYYLAVSYRGTVTVHFHAVIHPGFEKLAEVLECKIVLENTDEVLYEGLMRDMPKSLTHELVSKTATTDELEYEITVFLPTSVGNEYKNRELLADFLWWAEPQTVPGDADDEDDRDDDASDPMVPTSAPAHDTITDQTQADGSQEPFLPGELVNPPKTGDSSLLPIMVIAAGSAVFLLVLLLGKRRKEEADNE